MIECLKTCENNLRDESKHTNFQDARSSIADFCSKFENIEGESYTLYTFDHQLLTLTGSVVDVKGIGC